MTFETIVIRLLLLIARSVALGCGRGHSAADEKLLADAHRWVGWAESRNKRRVIDD